MSEAPFAGGMGEATVESVKEMRTVRTMMEIALCSPDEQDIFQISLALVPDGHRAHLIGVSPSLIVPPLRGLWRLTEH